MTVTARRQLVALALGFALVAGSCAESTNEPVVAVEAAAEAATQAAPAPTEVPAAEAAAVEPGPRPRTGGALALPSIDVVDLISGDTLDLAEYSPPGPTLVWFWAPF